jgi:hypothetical protein
MNDVIYRYDLKLNPKSRKYKLELPVGSDFTGLLAKEEEQVIRLYFRHLKNFTYTETREFELYLTGEEIPNEQYFLRDVLGVVEFDCCGEIIHVVEKFKVEQEPAKILQFPIPDRFIVSEMVH